MLVPEEDVFGKQGSASCKWEVGVPEEEVVGKQDAFGFNRV